MHEREREKSDARLMSGCSTGYGQHGDYVFGWEGDSLQRAMDNHCYLRNCTLLTEQAPKVKNLCLVPDTVDEDIDGCKYGGSGRIRSSADEK